MNYDYFLFAFFESWSPKDIIKKSVKMFVCVRLSGFENPYIENRLIQKENPLLAEAGFNITIRQIICLQSIRC